MDKAMEELYDRSVVIAKNYQQCQVGVIKILQEVEVCKLYYGCDLKSLYGYAQRVIKLSPANACAFITVARKAKKFPQLLEAISCGRISSHAARRICPVIDKDNIDLWIGRAEELSHRELEKFVKSQHPSEVKEDRWNYVNGEVVEMHLNLSEAAFKDFQYVQDLVSSQIKRAASYEETLKAMIEIFRDKKDPVRKAERVLERYEKKQPIKAEVPQPQVLKQPRANTLEKFSERKFSDSKLHIWSNPNATPYGTCTETPTLRLPTFF